jgi:hypothetical protein
MIERKHPYPNVVVGYTDPDTGLFVEGGLGGGEGGGSPSNGLTNTQLRAEAVVSQAQWEDGAYVLSPEGFLLSETQYNVLTEETRTRSWTYTTDVNNNVLATPGEWV